MDESSFQAAASLACWIKSFIAAVTVLKARLSFESLAVGGDGNMTSDRPGRKTRAQVRVKNKATRS